MKFGKILTASALAVSSIAVLSLTAVPAAPANARKASFLGGQHVNVSVSFQSQIPLSDVSEKTLMSAQSTGRRFMYQMVSKECAVLKETIAETCRLTNVSVSAQVRDQSNRGPVTLYLNGTAQYAITLNEKAVD